MKLHVETIYEVTSITEIEVPFSSWDEVDEWYIKWNFLNYRLKGDTEFQEYDLGDVEPNAIDIKRPSTVFIAKVNEDGMVNKDNPYVNQ